MVKHVAVTVETTTILDVFVSCNYVFDKDMVDNFQLR